MNEVELNGTTVDRETIRQWLINKHVTLWSDWLVTQPKQQEKAIDWLLGQMGQLSEFASKPKDPRPNGMKPQLDLSPRVLQAA